MRPFPKYTNHSVAKKNGCFNCHQEMADTPKKTDYPRGKYSLKCTKCGFTKYYDIDPTEEGAA